MYYLKSGQLAAFFDSCRFASPMRTFLLEINDFAFKPRFTIGYHFERDI